MIITVTITRTVMILTKADGGQTLEKRQQPPLKFVDIDLAPRTLFHIIFFITTIIIIIIIITIIIDNFLWISW